MLEYLQGCIHNERVEVLNATPAFFRNTMDALQGDIIIKLHKLYAGGKHAKRSLINFLRLVGQQEPTLTLPGTELNPSHVPLLIDRHLARVEAARPVLDRLAVHRDKVWAHDDKKYSDEPFKLHEDAPPSLKDLRELVALAQDILLQLNGNIRNIHMVMQPPQPDDASRLVGMLGRYLRWAKSAVVQELIHSGQLDL